MTDCTWTKYKCSNSILSMWRLQCQSCVDLLAFFYSQHSSNRQEFASNKEEERHTKDNLGQNSGGRGETNHGAPYCGCRRLQSGESLSLLYKTPKDMMVYFSVHRRRSRKIIWNINKLIPSFILKLLLVSSMYSREQNALSWFIAWLWYLCLSALDIWFYHSFFAGARSPSFLISNLLARLPCCSLLSRTTTWR